MRCLCRLSPGLHGFEASSASAASGLRRRPAGCGGLPGAARAACRGSPGVCFSPGAFPCRVGLGLALRCRFVRDRGVPPASGAGCVWSAALGAPRAGRLAVRPASRASRSVAVASAGVGPAVGVAASPPVGPSRPGGGLVFADCLHRVLPCVGSGSGYSGSSSYGGGGLTAPAVVIAPVGEVLRRDIEYPGLARGGAPGTPVCLARPIRARRLRAGRPHPHWVRSPKRSGLEPRAGPCVSLSRS